MALTTDKVLICNQALLLVGAGRIYDPDEVSEEARVCDVFFDTTLDEVITANNWNCARCRNTLALSPPHPSFGWTYRFSLPSDPYCLFVTREDNSEPFVVEGRYLLSDVSEVQIHYLRRITVMAELSPKLIECFIFKLAAKICIPLQGDIPLRNALENNYNISIMKSSGRESQEGDEQLEPQSGSWQNARYSRPITGRY